MKQERIKGMTPRIQTAIKELKGKISERYPDATYEVSYGEDPDGVRLMPVVDVEDILDVVDVVGDRLLELQVEEGLPLYVVPVRPPERVLEIMRKSLAKRSQSGGRAALSP